MSPTTPTPLQKDDVEARFLEAEVPTTRWFDDTPETPPAAETPIVLDRLRRQPTSFYASSEYLDVAARAYFDGRTTDVEYVEVDGHVFRLLVIGRRRVVTDLEFVDYHQPVTGVPVDASVRRHGYLKSVVQEVIESSEWDSAAQPDVEPAPFVDWSVFTTYEEYEAFLKARKKGLFNEQRRRNRRLAELGQIEFCMHDERSDALDLAVEWKSQQLRATGARNYLADSRNTRHFELLRDAGLLTTSTLRVDGRLVSVWLGFVHDDVWSGWIFAYDPDPALRKYSVGKQLLHSMLRESHRLGHREFDFSIGDEDYKWFFATHARVLGSVGRPPLTEQARSGVRRAKRSTKRALSRHPRLLEGATALGGAVRRERCRLVEQVSRFR